MVKNFFVIMKICLGISIRATVISLLVTSLLYSQNFNHIDIRLNSLKSKHYTSLNDLHKDLIYSDYSKSEKVYAIAKYITDNISYGERARSPLNTIRSKQGVCQDYSELFIALCKLSSIKNYYVTGDGRNNVRDIGFYNSNHAWNVVEIDGELQIYDLTWAAGTYDESSKKFTKKFKEEYFNANPEVFINDHYPDDPKWQLLDNPITITEYISKPVYSPEIKNLSLKEGIFIGNDLKISFASNYDFESASLFRWPLNQYGTTSGIEIPLTKNGSNYSLNYYEKIPGVYKYEFVFWPRNKQHDRNFENLSTKTTYNYSSSTIELKLITSNYDIPKPDEFDKNDPWGLIESYHYIFHKLDTSFFNSINSKKILDVAELNNAKHLSESLKHWIGDYRNFYTKVSGDSIKYTINNFDVILFKNQNGYEFKEIKKRVLKKGSYGYLVKQLQKLFSLEQSGFFDLMLENKIKEFQKNKNLVSDGIVGSNTYKYLNF